MRGGAVSALEEEETARVNVPYKVACESDRGAGHVKGGVLSADPHGPPGVHLKRQRHHRGIDHPYSLIPKAKGIRK